MTYPALVLLVGAPLALGIASIALGRTAAHALAVLAAACVVAGCVIAVPGIPLVIGESALGLEQIGRLELGFLAVYGTAVTGYHYLSGRASPLPALLPAMLAAVAAGRLFGPQLLVAASFLLITALLIGLLMIAEQPDWQTGVSGAAFLILTALGGMALLFGFVLADIQRLSPGGLVTVPFVVAVLSVGLALHLGVAPLHFWVSNAFERAGPASIALAIGLLGPATVGLLLQALTALPQLVVDDEVNGYLTAGGLFTAVFGAVAALAPVRLRRRLGYVFVSDIGFVLAGTVTYTRLGVTGAALHLAHRSLMVLVLVGSIAELERSERPTGNGAPPSPYLWGTLLVGMLSFAAVPPLSGFAGAWPIYQALSLADWRLALVLAATSLVCLAALLTALGRARPALPRAWPRPRPVEWALMVLAAFGALWGLTPGPYLGAIYRAVSQLPFLKSF